jgi:hypothetical protein
MKSKIVSLLFAFAVLSVFSAIPSADIIELKSGQIVEGEITEETEQFIAIETDAGTSFLEMDEIKSVKRTRLDVATGNIVEVTGAVDILPKGKEQWMPLREGMILNEGDSVRTGPDSKAIAVFEDQVIMALEPESDAELERLQQSVKKDLSMKVNVGKGQIWNDVGKLRTKRSTFYVETPQVVTGVRGTVFTVLAGPDEKTTVAVVSGGVDVRTRDMMMDPIKVKESQMTEVTPNKPPTTPTAISGAFLAQWALLQGKFGLLHGGMSAQGFQVTPTQAAVAGGAVAAGVTVAAAAGGGGGGGSTPPDTVIVTASETGIFSPGPIDTDIDGSSAIGGRSVVGVSVRVLCDPFTVPDQFQIVYMGAVIGDTGMVGEDLGDPGENILLNGSANGSSPIVTIRVISGPLGTDWHWDARVTYQVE